MIKKEFVDYLAEKSGIKRSNLIEKDFLLQRFAQELIKDGFFSSNFVFKGGTCLIKCYLGYYRFSEDLDFTWRNQKIWENKSGKQIRKVISLKITKLLSLINKICMGLELDFKPDKKDKLYVEFGAGGIFITLKVWYDSCITNDKQFIKLQINFVEKIAYKLKKLPLNNLAQNVDLREMDFLFPEYKDAFAVKSYILNYDISEILAEKVRAIITRKGVKTRDFLDVYFISRYLKKNVEDYEKVIIEKILFALKYEKYLINIVAKHKQFAVFEMEDKEDILLEPVGEDFGKFMENFYISLNQLLQKIKAKSLNNDNYGKRY